MIASVATGSVAEISTPNKRDSNGWRESKFLIIPICDNPKIDGR